LPTLSHHSTATPHVFTVQLSQALTTDVIVYFELKGTAALGWTYIMKKPRARETNTVQQVKLKAGKTKARISLRMMDQMYVPKEAKTIEIILHVDKLKEQGVVVDAERGVFHVDIFDQRRRPKKFAYHDEL
jgi:hypothetical protein